MKHIHFTSILLFLLIIFAEVVQSQYCGTDDYMDNLFKEHPEYKISYDQNNAVIFSKQKSSTSISGIIRIPVVVHVVYKNSTENISDNQIHTQIWALNEDFRKNNPDINKIPVDFKSLAADVGIEFYLATKDENNNPTTGITRTYTTVEYFTYKEGEKVKYNSTGGHSIWDRSKYLNIWVCDVKDGLLGYTANFNFPKEVDGVVIDYKCFGQIGTAITPHNLGRVTTHEIGHWLGLKHIFSKDEDGDGNGDCIDSDGIDDTPIQANYNTGCPAYPKTSCDNSPFGEMFMNYMDYTDDACKFMFTTGQKEVMHSAILNYRSSFIVQIPVANFSSSAPSCKVGNSITFTDESTNNPTSWSWTFSITGEATITSAVQNPQITFNTAGVYNVTLISMNSGASSLPVTKTNFITVSPKTPPGCNFTMSATQITKGQSVTYSDISPNSPTSWDWTFIGGSPSVGHLKNHTVTYNTAGTYSVTLLPTNADGSSINPCTQTITVVESQINISGKVENGTKLLGGVTITFSPGGTTTTKSDGTYSFSVPYNWSGTIKPEPVGYTFIPIEEKKYKITSNLTVNFAAYVKPVYSLVAKKIEGCEVTFEIINKPFGLITYDFGDGSPESNYCSNPQFRAYGKEGTFDVKAKVGEYDWVYTKVTLKNPPVLKVRDYKLQHIGNSWYAVAMNSPFTIKDASLPITAVNYLYVDWNGGDIHEVCDVDEVYSKSSEVLNYYHTFKKDKTITTIPWDGDRIVSHSFNNEGSKNVRVSILSYPDHEFFEFQDRYIGTNVVDCDKTRKSSDFNGIPYGKWDWGGEAYFAGIFELNKLTQISDYNNRNIILSACKSITLKPDAANPTISIKPSSGKYFKLEVGKIENSNNYQKSYSAPDSFIKEEIAKDVKPILKESEDINIFPNPTSGILTVTCGLLTNTQVQLFTISGTRVSCPIRKEGNFFYADLSNHVDGLYILKIISNEVVKEFKVVKK